MPKLHSSKHVARVLMKHEFAYISQRGSHIKFRKYGNPTLTVIVPAGKREIPVGTFHSILRQSRLNEDDFTLISYRYVIPAKAGI